MAMEKKLERMEETQHLILNQLQSIFGLPGRPTPHATSHGFGLFQQAASPVTPTLPPDARRAIIAAPESFQGEIENIESRGNAPTDPNTVTNAMPLSLRHVYKNAPLPSTEIPKQSLMSVDEVLETVLNEKKEIAEEKVGTVAQTLAKQAIFGTAVMKQCTPAGSKDLPALPKAELFQLKVVVFRQLPKYWRKPDDFEIVWKERCWVAIEQACRRLRHK